MSDDIWERALKHSKSVERAFDAYMAILLLAGIGPFVLVAFICWLAS